MSDPHLVAYVVNAISLDTAEVVLTVATRDVDDEWYDNHDMHVLPFWTIALSKLGTAETDLHRELFFMPLIIPAIPPNWITHIHAEANRAAAKATAHKGSGLLASLGLDLQRRPAAPIKPMRR